jgi:ABC-type multidrug transport system fused ATPase/permease subunit
MTAQRMDVAFYPSRLRSDSFTVVARLTGDVAAIETLMLSGLADGLTYVLRILMFGAALFILAWQLALAALIVAPVFWLVTRHFSREIKTASREKFLPADRRPRAGGRHAGPRDRHLAAGPRASHNRRVRCVPRLSGPAAQPDPAPRSTRQHRSRSLGKRREDHRAARRAAARDLRLSDLRSQIALVLQETLIFHGTIRENIAFGSADATDEQVLAAAAAAGAHEFILEQPEGYQTVVGQRGRRLSGGQRQRIAIARAMVRDAPVLILDEPTTGLDAVSSREVLGPLERLMHGRAVLVISHDLGATRDADRIVVIEAGRVHEHGTHAELLRRGDGYARLWDAAGPRAAQEPAIVSAQPLRRAIA